ncbi:MAG: hypothetical protein KDA37_02395 [Planctomycetales bacterium]|nr:hypothetical protein [Planctomycetales bacterium]
MSLPRLYLTLLALAAFAAATPTGAQSLNAWALKPYRIHALVAVDTMTTDSAAFGEAIQDFLYQRTNSAIGPQWDLRVTIAPVARREEVRRVASGRSDDIDQLPGLEETPDKTFLFAVQEDVRGIRVAVRELDHTLRRLSLPLAAPVASLDQAPESVFQLACDAFSPLAVFRLDPENRQRVLLDFRAAELPIRADAPDWVREGDVFVPVLRRAERDGTIAEDGVRPVPWTYVRLTEVGEQTAGQFVSHTRVPIAGRRRGRVDYLAIRLPRETSPITLRAHARDREDKPLAGYQVYTQDGDAERVYAGATGPDGRLTIPPGKDRILMAFIKSGTQLVAKLPVVPGAEREMSVPLLDESVRLEAEAKLGILREDLIDLVAQRKLTIARIDAAIDEKDLGQAAKLINQLERLPGRALFDRQIRQLEQQSRSDVPMVQQRIDRIFSDTRIVLAAFLSPREIQEVKLRLSEAQK